MKSTRKNKAKRVKLNNKKNYRNLQMKIMNLIQMIKILKLRTQKILSQKIPTFTIHYLPHLVQIPQIIPKKKIRKIKLNIKIP